MEMERRMIARYAKQEYEEKRAWWEDPLPTPEPKPVEEEEASTPAPPPRHPPRENQLVLSK